MIVIRKYRFIDEFVLFFALLSADIKLIAFDFACFELTLLKRRDSKPNTILPDNMQNYKILI